MQPKMYHRTYANGLCAVTMVAFVPFYLYRKVRDGTRAPSPRIVACARTVPECERKIERICRDTGLPLRATMATRRIVNSPYDMRRKRKSRAKLR